VRRIVELTGTRARRAAQAHPHYDIKKKKGRQRGSAAASILPAALGIALWKEISYMENRGQNQALLAGRRCVKRVGSAAVIPIGSRRRTRISGQFAPRLIEMLESPAYRALSLSALRVITRIEIELAHHGGTDNGLLPVTYDDFERYGIHRQAIASAIREVVALGFVEITEHGRAGNAEWRTPSRYRLTYRPAKDKPAKGLSDDGTHEWRRIKDQQQAELIAKLAREAKPEKQNSSGGFRTKAQYGIRTTNRHFHSTESTTTGHSTESTTTIYISRGDVSAEGGIHALACERVNLPSLSRRELANADSLSLPSLPATQAEEVVDGYARASERVDSPNHLAGRTSVNELDFISEDGTFQLTHGQFVELERKFPHVHRLQARVRAIYREWLCKISPHRRMTALTAWLVKKNEDGARRAEARGMEQPLQQKYTSEDAKRDRMERLRKGIAEAMRGSDATRVAG
jgi:hypothetical protein